MRVCSEPGCPELTKAGKCSEHRKAARRRSERGRPSAVERGYGKAWRKTRTAFLRAFPTCIDCGDVATVADHAPRTRADLIAQGAPDPDAFEHLEPRCASCHSSKTGREDGGYGNRKKKP